MCLLFFLVSNSWYTLATSMHRKHYSVPMSNLLTVTLSWLYKHSQMFMPNLMTSRVVEEWPTRHLGLVSRGQNVKWSVSAAWLQLVLWQYSWLGTGCAAANCICRNDQSSCRCPESWFSWGNVTVPQGMVPFVIEENILVTSLTHKCCWLFLGYCCVGGETEFRL